MRVEPGSYRLPSLIVVLAVLVLAPARAQAQCRFPDDDKANSLTYRFQPETLPVGAVLHVTLETRVDGVGRLELFLPTRWAGEDLHGVTQVHTLTSNATIDRSADGRVAIVHAPANQRVVVAYDLTKDWNGPLVHPRQFHAVVMPEYVEFTGSNALVRPSLDDNTNVTVHFDWQKLPTSWALATSFGAGTLPRDRCQTFSGRSIDFFHGLYAAGDFRIHRFQIGRRPAVLAVRGTWTFTDDDAIGQIQKVVGLVRDFWHDDHFPYFLVTLKPYDRDRGSSDGSAFTNAFWMYVSRQDSFASLLPQLAHEAFHAWNPLQMGPIPAEAERETGWFKEGFTSYYGALIVYRAGALPLASYVESLNRDLRQFPASHDEYVRGRVIALWLDGEIRRQSGGRRSLDDVMFAMVRDAKQPLTMERILETAGRDLTVDARTLLRHAVSDHGDLPAPELLPLAGACARATVQQLATYDAGFDVARSRATSQITGVDPGGPAFAAGLRDGQTLNRISLSTGDPDRQAQFTVGTADGDRQIAYFPRGPAAAAWQYAILPGCK